VARRRCAGRVVVSAARHDISCVRDIWVGLLRAKALIGALAGG
jgi:hypothetical protein